MRAYMEKLRARGELLEVHRPVHPKHELAAVSDAAHRRWGKPISVPQRDRLETSGAHQHLWFARETCRDHRHRPEDLLQAMEQSGDDRRRPRYACVGPVEGRGRLRHCKLSDLPLITYSERDAGPYFTSAMFLAKEPETGVQNFSFHRSMYVSDTELRCRLAPRHHLTMYHEKAEQRGEFRSRHAHRPPAHGLPDGRLPSGL